MFNYFMKIWSILEQKLLFLLLFEELKFLKYWFGRFGFGSSSHSQCNL